MSAMNILIEKGLSPAKVINPKGHWYRSSPSHIWYTLYEGQRYTYFEKKWYREQPEAAQSRRMQRDAAEGSPLLFSGGR